MTPANPTDNRYAGPLSPHIAGLPAAWRDILAHTDVAATLAGLDAFLNKRLAANAVIFPAHPFRALQGLAPDDVHVVILGQDPYHGPGQAHGLAFSVPEQCPCPPSLRNIFTELKLEFPDRLTLQSHDLSRWAQQGVLLLNTVLTVESGKPASHARHGWEAVTDALIRRVAQGTQPKVFMLWGNHAQQKRGLIPDNAFNLVLCANHPSPLSARRPPVPFIGCGHFAQTNAWLTEQGQRAINW
ncbi:uracil-DNA glycosylase [Pusillimonas sp. NJUB218]|uniref:uracil-DNA glycosylase n=1 Tax=Pusillimonas sp. NJUB218 TaxID=2023230 RepID=UPI000F4C1B19|nr:uracil-DNA glycosylase [Pusillimonas sp. NJUB218]ROT45853.1 uracil-DNA glycosylase [Pusillimonas sp. NJUB218]